MLSYVDKKVKCIILISILAVAAIFRFYQINSLPAGLFPDEAANGLDAEHILEGKHNVFFEKGNGREGMYFYILAFIFKILGPGIWQIHLTSAIIGFLAIIAFYFLAKEWFDWKIAALACFFAAISIPATVMSRVGFRAVLITLTTPLFFLFLTKAFLSSTKSNKYKNLLYPILAGFFLGLSLYTYISARILAAAFVLFILVIFIWKKKWLNLFIIGASSFITFLPLGIYFIKHPEWLFERTGHVSIFNPDLNNGSALLTLFLNIKKAFLMFFMPGAGDLNWRHNISSAPFFNIFTAVLFFAGFVYLIYKLILKIRNHKNCFLPVTILIWFLTGLAPMILSAEAIPHFLRAQGIIPVVFIFSALGVLALWELSKSKFCKIVLSVVLIFVFSTSLLLNFTRYFIFASLFPENHYAFRADLTETAELINSRNNVETTFLVLDDYSVQTIDFLTYKSNNFDSLGLDAECDCYRRHATQQNAHCNQACSWGGGFTLVKPELVNEREYPENALVIFTESTEYDFKRFNKNVENKLIKYLWK